jgi:hypothetical protein
MGDPLRESMANEGLCWRIIVCRLCQQQGNYALRRWCFLSLSFGANYSSFQAVGVQATENGVAVTTKKPSNPQQPAQNLVTVTYGPSTSNRK